MLVSVYSQQKKTPSLRSRGLKISNKLVTLILATFLLVMVFLGAYTFGDTDAPEFNALMGGQGGGEGQFLNPKGIAIDRFDYMYVVDSHNQRIQKFTEEGEFVTSWGFYGTLNGQFRSPYGIAVDSRGNVFVTDQINNNVQRFDSEGNFMTKWGTKPIPRTGARSRTSTLKGVSPETYFSQPGAFDGPTGIATDSARNIYVADSGNQRIQKFDKRGQFMLAWELLGVKEEHETGDILDTSQGLAIDSEDNVYVVDKFSNRIQKFDSEGRFLAFLPKDTLSSPEGITIDDEGSLYITDKKAGVVEKYDHEGNLVDSIKSFRPGNEKSVSIIGIAVSRSGNLYISDSRNHNIQKFEQSPLMPNLQLFVNDLDLAFTYLFEEQSARMRLMPDSVNGVRVNSGQKVNELGSQAVIGRMSAGDTGKVVAFTIQNHDFRLEHKVRVQLGYLDKDRDFVVRHDSLVSLNKFNTAGDSMLIPIEPFFVPADQVAKMREAYIRDFVTRFGDIPSNLLSGEGTIMVARMAADGQTVPLEISLSLIQNP